MFKNKAADGKLNISGAKIAKLRLDLPGKISQRMLAEQLQLMEIDLEKNASNKLKAEHGL